MGMTTVSLVRHLLNLIPTEVAQGDTGILEDTGYQTEAMEMTEEIMETMEIMEITMGMMAEIARDTILAVKEEEAMGDIIQVDIPVASLTGYLGLKELWQN